MDSWKSAWIILKKDLRGDRLYLIWNVIFMLYTGLMISVMFRPSDEAKIYISPVSDFLMLMLIPVTGFFFSRRSFSYLKEDSYTQMLRYYRTLPIPLPVIMKSRILQLIAALLFNGIFFYTTIYLISSHLRSELGLGQFLAMALTWTGYGLMMNGLYICFELLMKGRAYLWMTLVSMIAVGLLAFVIDWFGGNVTLFSIEMSKQYSLLSPLMWGVLALGILVLIVCCNLTQRKLVKRDLA
ncbi:hypothetical protein ACFQ3W_14025 [Paenibacillus puldeungensis]|uniref:ABC-2 type transport system permease protein n=1 Tax=Paenibacillus puldeungensis TaxID=696536 RepID=A0ABW3RY28_9BACL